MTGVACVTDKGFEMPIRVYYADTDAGGIVYHSVYLDMAERCRTELLRHFDWPLLGLDGQNFIVRRASIDWQAPARLDDLMICTTSVAKLGGATVSLRQVFSLEGRDLCHIALDLVYVSSEMKPIRLAPELRDKFERLEMK
jgi:acyl-CoA thioester hydrolase